MHLLSQSFMSINLVVSSVHTYILQRQEIDVEKYWRYEFTSAMSGRDLTRFVVLSVEPVIQAVRASAKKRGTDRKMRMAECVVVREDDLGSNDRQFTCLTNLGHILKEGDTVVG